MSDQTTQTAADAARAELAKATPEDVRAARQFIEHFKMLDLSEMPEQFFAHLASLVPADFAAGRLSLEEVKAVLKDRSPKTFDTHEFDAQDFAQDDQSPAANLIRTIHSMAEQQYGDTPDEALRYEKHLLRRKIRELMTQMQQPLDRTGASRTMLHIDLGESASVSAAELAELREKAAKFDQMQALLGAKG